MVKDRLLIVYFIQDFIQADVCIKSASENTIYKYQWVAKPVVGTELFSNKHSCGNKNLKIERRVPNLIIANKSTKS